MIWWQIQHSLMKALINPLQFAELLSSVRNAKHLFANVFQSYQKDKMCPEHSSSKQEQKEKHNHLQTLSHTCKHNFCIFIYLG